MSECITTLGTPSTGGYCQVWIDGRFVMAHRHVWATANGPIPEGMVVMHTCDNPPCSNLDHLRLGTQADNMADAAAKGRMRNQNTTKTHCINGHRLDGDNLYVNPSGHRQCRTCKRERDRRSYHTSKN